MSSARAVDELRRAEVTRLVASALEDPEEVWIVGGAVRDALRDRPVDDLDLAIAGDPCEAAMEIAREGSGHAFELSSAFSTWRVVARDERWQVDLAALRGESIEADLAERDFTIGALAVPLAAGGILDPHGGVADLEAGLVRAVGADSFRADPLRLLRAARLGAETGLRLDPSTVTLARAEAARAAEPAGERQFAELALMLAGPDPLRGLELMDDLGILAAVLPEVESMRGVGQNPNHHLDVLGHTLAVLARWLEVEDDLERFAGACADQVSALLAEPLSDGLTRGGAMRFAALLHDSGKPATRARSGDIVTFIGHDRAGAEVVDAFCARLRASRKLARHLGALTLHHLRLGFMVHERPLAPRRIHEYLRATEPVSVEVTLLTIADRLAARGSGPIASGEMVEAHLSLAREMIAAGFEFRRDGPPPPLLRGDELAAELGIVPGPGLGALLSELEAAQYAGEVNTRAEAVAHARRCAGAGR